VDREANCGFISRERKTKFIDIFRTTPVQTVCPNFYVMAHANGCAFQPKCEYCYLKSSFWYLDDDLAFSNVGKMVEETEKWIAKDGLESYILNTGNLSDSLAFEKNRPLVSRLIEVFRTQAEAKGRQHTLLLLTKGGMRECETLLSAKPCRNVIVSFSVNSPEVAARYEQGAAPVEDRLAAAKKLKYDGWRLRMRIDPMFAGFDYSWVTDQLRGLACERVTLGTLRAEPSLFKMVNHGLFDALEQPAEPKAMARYPKDVRIAIYKPAVEALLPVSSVGLCEETEEVWKAAGLDSALKSCNCGE
jgi:spore photoproduct lyase